MMVQGSEPVRRRRFRRPLTLSLAAVAAGLLGTGLLANAGGADAQTGQTSAAHIRSIDSREAGKTRVSLSMTGKLGASPTYAIGNDEPKALNLVPDTRDRDVMVVLDSSRKAGNRLLQQFKDQAMLLAPGENGVTRLGVVSTGGDAVIPLELTDDASKVAVDLKPVAMAPIEGTHVYDGVVLAAKRLTAEGANNDIVLFHASSNSGEGADIALVRRALRETHTRLHVVDLIPESSDGVALAQLVRELGGSYIPTTEAKLEAATAQVTAKIANQFSAEVPTPKDPTRTNLTLNLNGSTQLIVSFQPGGLVESVTDLAPLAIENDGWTSAFDSPIVMWSIAALAILAAGGLAWAALTIAIKDNDSVRARLEAYTVGASQARQPQDDDSVLGTSELLKRAVAKSGEFAERRGFAEKIDLLLEQADVKLHAGEVAFLMVATPVLTGAFGFMVSGSLLIALVFAGIGAMLPKSVLSFKATRRMRAFDQQLPDALQLLAGTLRAGFSISQAVTAVAEDIDDPIGQELRRCVAEMQLGRQLEDALDAAADRLNSKDFRWTVLAIRIQREVGGNLSELLVTVADTMVQRQRLLRDVRGMTAEGRMSAGVLGALPLGMIGFLAMSNPGYLKPLTYGTGMYVAIASAVLMVAGFFWMNKIIKIEV